MKKIAVAAILLVMMTALILALRKPSPATPSSAQNPSLSALVSPTPHVQLPVTVTPALSADSVILIGNYTERKTSEEIAKEHNCAYLVNGGFYTTTSTPVGLFKSGTVSLRGGRESALFDGYISRNQMDTPLITRMIPDENSTWALQTGPILIENGKAVPLSIKNDQPERRSFALITGANELIFGLVEQSTLTALPQVISNWARENSVIVGDAINLDGGSAAAFRGENGVYPEIAPIGSAFCAQL